MTAKACTTAHNAEGVAAAIGLEKMANTISAYAKRTSALILDAVTTGQIRIATDLAEGRTPTDLPEPGTGAEGRRLVLTATAMARRGKMTPQIAANVWGVYTAAIWADEADAELQELARAIMCAGLAPVAPWPTETTAAVDPTAHLISRGLTEPAASNAPPARPEFSTATRGGVT
jgi:hypothetical protein